MTLKIFTDGGSRGNPGPAAAAFVVYEGAGILREKRGKFLGTATNNEAEYWGVIEALGWLKANLTNWSNLTNLAFFSDSQLVVNQLNGLWKIKEPRLRELLLMVREKERALAPVRITYLHIPREKNAAADRLVNETLDLATIKGK